MAFMVCVISSMLWRDQSAWRRHKDWKLFKHRLDQAPSRLRCFCVQGHRRFHVKLGHAQKSPLIFDMSKNLDISASKNGLVNGFDIGPSLED